MPTGPALITRQELANALGILIGTLNVTTADYLIALGSDLVRDELNQRIDLVADEEVTLLGSGTPVLLLPELPVVDVTVVELGEHGPSSAETIASTDFYLEAGPDGRTGILRRLNGIWPRRRPILVTYSHGYELPVDDDPSLIPGAIRLAVARAASRGYYTTDGIRQETIGRYSVTYAAEAGVFLSDIDKSGLARYYPGHRAGAK